MKPPISSNNLVGTNKILIGRSIYNFLNLFSIINASTIGPKSKRQMTKLVLYDSYLQLIGRHNTLKRVTDFFGQSSLGGFTLTCFYELFFQAASNECCPTTLSRCSSTLHHDVEEEELKATEEPRIHPNLRITENHQITMDTKKWFTKSPHFLSVLFMRENILEENK